MKKADNNKRTDGKNSISESNECLCLENKSKSLSNFVENNTVFFINKIKIPLFY